MLEMGFDKHFYEDHCYLDDPADGVAMNVEIIEENYQSPQNNEQSIIYLDQSGSSSSYSNMNVISEDIKTSSKKALVFLPYSEYCTDHKDLYLHRDEKLVKPGDKFRSLEDFVQYLNENAKRWCFYYKCSDSRKPNTEYESFTYNCVYLRNKEKYKKKGLRKRNNNMKTNCPCKIKLRHLPNEKELTVVYVCNHHDHDLSVEEFYKLQHGRRLPPHVKEEIMDLLKLKVDVMKIRAYVAMETGFNMSRPFFYALEKNMKSRNMDRQITEDRLMMLREKIAAAENTEPSKKTKHVRSLDDTEETRRTPPLKKRSKTTNAITSSEHSKRLKIQECPSNSYSSETLESVKHLQESVKCEIQRNPWVLDQCVPVLPNSTAIQSNCEEPVHCQTIVEETQEDAHRDAQNDLETFSYTIDYYDSDDNNTHEIVSNELSETIDEGQVDESEENYIDNIAYETVVTDNNHEEQSETIEYVNEELIEENVEIHVDTQEHVADENGTINDDLENTHEVEEIENHVDYVTEDNDEVEYINEVNEENAAHDVGVQTADNIKAAQMLMPVFDVYMKDGNVTGFVVNDNMISGLKDGVDKGIQTSEDLTFSDSQELEDEDLDCDIIHDEESDTYTKHEYVHRYNIDKYMVQPHFPKYVETLAKETYMDVLHMFTNIYNEKAMFKITTTQKGKEGNTRIWYVADGSKRQRKNGKNKEKLKKRLQSAFVLKDRVRTLIKHNSELVTRNKQLEEVALKLVDMA